MGGKKGGENTKKAAGNAKKAEVAAQKQAVVDADNARKEDADWSKGAKSNAKKDAAAAKALEQQKKKAETAALLAAEEASQPTKPKPTKQAPKKTASHDGPPLRTTGISRPLDLADLDSPHVPTSLSTLSATGIDSALDALSLTTTTGTDMKIDKHPERRFKAAYLAFEARRLPEIEAENPGLRRQQRVEMCRKEFEKSDENPFNSGLVGRFDMTKEDAATVRKGERERMERNLG